MELHHLRYVLKLAEQLHFSRAAADLNITQPSLSQCILQIEQECGVRLFERKTRSVRLTPAGEEFASHAEKVLAELALLQDSMRKHSTPQSENLQIGTLLNMARLTINTCLVFFHRAHPQIRLTIHELLGSLELLRQLEAGTFDAVFVILAPDAKLPTTIENCPVLRGRVVAVLPTAHRFACRTSVALADLAEESLIFPAKSHSLFAILAEACRSNGFEPKIAAHISQAETGVEMAAKGIGVTLASSQFVDSIACRDVVALPVEPAISRTISLAYSRQSAKLAAIETFRDFVLQGSDR